MSVAVVQVGPNVASPTAFRLLVLFLRQRSILHGLLAMPAIGVLLIWMTEWVEASAQGARLIVVLMTGPAVIACVVGISAWSPTADLELASSYPLQWPRLVHLVGLLAIGTLSSAIVVDSWTVQLPGSVPATELWIRNVIGLTGLALILGRFINPRLSWLAPCTMSIVAAMKVPGMSDDPQTTINEQFLVPMWIFIGRDHRSEVQWVIAIGLFALGMLLIARFGPKVTDVGEV